jgi:hypothetical protein
MSEPTRREAVAKLDAFIIEMGYPATWRADAAPVVAPGPFWANLVAARAHETARQLAKIGRPVDRSEWLVTAPTVDAYFDERLNRAAIAAGLLQPPYFEAGGDDAANYGAIGVVLAHELIHGFDARGRKFDARGNLRDWWAPEDEREFLRRAALVVDQYERYVVIDGAHIDGTQTLSENIADVASVKLAYAAMQRALRGRPRQLIGGLTPSSGSSSRSLDRGAACTAPNTSGACSARTRTHQHRGACSAHSRTCPLSPRHSAAVRTRRWCAPLRSGRSCTDSRFGGSRQAWSDCRERHRAPRGVP